MQVPGFWEPSVFFRHTGARPRTWSSAGVPQGESWFNVLALHPKLSQAVPSALSTAKS